MAFETLMRDCANHEDARQHYAAALASEEARLVSEFIAQANAGKYERLRDIFDYRDCDNVVFRALVLCANKGNVEAKDALNTLARTYAEVFAEVDE